MSVPIELQREMGCSLTEFERWLPGATRFAAATRQGNTYRLSVDAGAVEITLEERPPRRIALLAIPVLSVHFRFIDMDAEARKSFLKYFDHYTKRGGG